MRRTYGVGGGVDFHLRSQTTPTSAPHPLADEQVETSTLSAPNVNVEGPSSGKGVWARTRARIIQRRLRGVGHEPTFFQGSPLDSGNEKTSG
jgi:hypothetical protein